MARPSGQERLKPIKSKMTKFDTAISKIREGCLREPPKLADIGLYIGEAQAMFVDVVAYLRHYGLLEDEDENVIEQMENSLNDIERCLKEEIINVPIIGMNTGMLYVCSDNLKEGLGLNQVSPSATKSGAK